MSNPNISKYGKNTQFKPGQSGNPKGRPKGAKNLTTSIQRLLEDEKIADKIFKVKPSYWPDLPDKNIFMIISLAMATKAAKGDVKAANWILKASAYDKEVKYREVEVIKERQLMVLDMNSSID